MKEYENIELQIQVFYGISGNSEAFKIHELLVKIPKFINLLFTPENKVTIPAQSVVFTLRERMTRVTKLANKRLRSGSQNVFL